MRTRLLLFLVVIDILTGCSSSRYQTVDLTGEAATSAAAVEQENAEDSLPETGEQPTVSPSAEPAAMFQMEPLFDGEEALSARENYVYTPVDETVAVIADVLNVREEDSREAKIYVQLNQGDTLHRTGVSEEWSRVIYDGKIVYVVSEMVEVVEEPDAAGEVAGSGDGSLAGEDGLADSGVPAEEALAGSGVVSRLADTGNGDAVSGEDGSGAGDSGGEGGQTGETGAIGRAAENRGNGNTVMNGRIIAVDAGHQAKANLEKEPVGPSSSTMKAKMPEGSTGTATGAKEHELTLAVAKKLETALAGRGYQVVMVRTTNDVNLSNAERSVIANESGADIFIRLHANSMENSSVYGVLAMCMTAQNPYNASLHTKSYNLSKKIVDQICAQTGTKNRGVQEIDSSGEINWCEIPVSVVEMGFLSNPDEDRWLQDDSYQDKIVEGICDAVDAYFAEGN